MQTPTPFLGAKVYTTNQWWSQPGSNRRPPACKAGALPAELWPQEHSNIRPTERIPVPRCSLPPRPWEYLDNRCRQLRAIQGGRYAWTPLT
jgi:hypothetical protein